MAYGVPGPIVARVPDSDASMPWRSFSWRAHHVVEEPESAVRMASSGSRDESSHATRCGVSGVMCSSARSSTTLPPLRDLPLDEGAPRPVRLPVQTWDQCSQRLLRVADELDVHRVADADHPAVDVDLDAVRLALLRQPFGVREAGPDHEERVAVRHHLVARGRAEQADRTGDEGKVVGRAARPSSALATPAPRSSAASITSSWRLGGALPDEHRDSFAFVQHLGGPVQVGLGGQDPRLATNRCSSTPSRARAAATAPLLLPGRLRGR